MLYIYDGHCENGMIQVDSCQDPIIRDELISDYYDDKHYIHYMLINNTEEHEEIHVLVTSMNNATMHYDIMSPVPLNTDRIVW